MVCVGCWVVRGLIVTVCVAGWYECRYPGLASGPIQGPHVHHGGPPPVHGEGLRPHHRHA
eukprot:187151-Pyramimonas_sp.AAC.1